jgi:hypothetical protein
MNKVYFSNIENPNCWENSDLEGVLKVWIIPKKWWSIKAWKIALDFSKSFSVEFLK